MYLTVPRCVNVLFLFMMTFVLYANGDEEVIVVVASKVEESPLTSAGSSAAITSKQMLARGDVSLVELLDREPGVDIPFDDSGVDGLVPYLQGGSKAVNIRGLENNRVNILVDGIRQPVDFTARSFGGSGGPGRIYFDPAVLSQIEIYKSASSNLYGSGSLSGTVSGRSEQALTLLGEELDGFELNASSLYSTRNNSFNQRVASAWGNGEIAGSVVYSNRVGHEQENHSDSPDKYPTDFHLNAAVLNGVYAKNDFLFSAVIDLYQFNSSSVFDELSLLSGLEEPSILEVERQRQRYSLDTQWLPSFADSFEAKLKVYYQDSLSETYNTRFTNVAGQPFQDRKDNIFYSSELLGAHFESSVDHSLLSVPSLFQVGVDYAKGFLDTQVNRDTTIVPLGENETDTIPGMAPTNYSQFGLGLSNRFYFGADQQLEITPSIRFEYFKTNPENTNEFTAETDRAVEDYENFAYSPSLTVLYHLNDETNLYYTASRGYRNPTAEELYGVLTHDAPGTVTDPETGESRLLPFINLPNASLEEESSISQEIGIQHSGSVVEGQLAFFYNTYNDFFVFGRQTGETVFVNGSEYAAQTTTNEGSALIYGVELKSKFYLEDLLSGFEGVTVTTAFDWSHGTVSSPLVGTRPLNTISPWMLSGGLGYDAPEGDWGVNLMASYTAHKESKDIDPDSAAVPTGSYFQLDLSGYYKPTSYLTVRAGLKNLLNQKYILWSRSNRGNGHNNTNSNDRETEPGINGFLALEYTF